MEPYYKEVYDYVPSTTPSAPTETQTTPSAPNMSDPITTSTYTLSEKPTTNDGPSSDMPTYDSQPNPQISIPSSTPTFTPLDGSNTQSHNWSPMYPHTNSYNGQMNYGYPTHMSPPNGISSPFSPSYSYGNMPNQMRNQMYNPQGPQLMGRSRGSYNMLPNNNSTSSGSNFLSSIMSSLMYLFSSTSVLLSNITRPSTNVPSLQFNPTPAIEYHPRYLGRTEEWKDNEWKNWMHKLEGEWIDFNNTIEREKGKWINAKEKDWEEFIQFMDNKWMHYNVDLERDVKSDILKKSLTLDEEEWKEWIKTEGKDLMERDLRNWITNNESYLDVWSVKEWLKWKNQKIVTWIMTDWKCEEDEYWSKWEESWAKNPNVQDRTSWLNWRERLNKEMVQWNSWVMMKEQHIRENRSNIWSKWKSDKHVLFNLWMDSFINRWIHEKQWFVWVRERNHLRSRDRYLRYK
ncbi:hypothetical protein AK88_04811 [Plasmodium fragile]|uniref:Tryptophan/threonine-rich plasmodium antigen C-terminal domain-containing protein n=1 Tax=Plasmodium fragile TaxID=5857 RepID=A0A0D9QER4_PLAFR|nr:uncharacterized protein AK88_04811 [Plasmodium fragile]KJP85545.1 hypothetical protein AK88_04811 [Plasmodium fragile]